MAKQVRYLPILWAKDGEYGALRQLPSEVRECMTPLLEIPPVPWNYAEDRPDRTIDQHLEKVASRIHKAWGIHDPVLLDFEWINPDERLTDDSHPVTYVFGRARRLDVKLVPVVTLGRVAAYRTAVGATVRRDGRGVCLRLQPDDLTDRQVSFKITDLLKDFGITPQMTDLLVDVRGIDAGTLERTCALVREASEAIPQLNAWRSFALAGTGFPNTLAGLPPQDISRIARTEWALWRRLSRQRGIRRVPIFGDYGISSPAPPDVDPRIMQPSASVRYTSDNEWVVVKGRNLKDHGYAQFHDVCRRVLRVPEYSGQDFSWGDRYIYDCANRRASRGNLTTWRKVGTSHHLTFVVDQLANAA